MDRRGALLGWEAVGRVDTGRGFCTGTLIARDIVLTAAHCVYDRDSAAPIPAANIRFRAGYYRGRHIAARRVTNWVVPDEYVPTPGGRHDGTMIPRDVALLRLDREINAAEADPFRVIDGPPDGTEVSVVSYGEGREDVLSREPSCAITSRYRGGVLGFDCDVTFGSSGAPVFTRTDGRLRIVSVISTVGDAQDGKRPAYGMILPAQVAALKRKFRAEAARPRISRGAKRVTVGQRTGTGARFVRPNGS